MKSGLTFIELIIVIAISLVILTIILGSFSRFNRSVTFDRDAEKILSMLHKARSDTLASKNDVRYGVHFEGTKIVIFSGSVYNPNSPQNEIFYLKSFESISNISVGGGSDVLFDRITGATSNFGSVTLSVLGGSLPPKIISISANGLSSI